MKKVYFLQNGEKKQLDMKYEKKAKIKTEDTQEQGFVFDDDQSQAEGETDLAMAVRLLLHELQEMMNLYKTAIINKKQANAIARIKSIAGYKVIPINQPLIEDVLRLSMSINGERSKQIENMAIGVKADMLARQLTPGKGEVK